MKLRHIDRVVIAVGVAILFSGGIARAALVPDGTAPQAQVADTEASALVSHRPFGGALLATAAAYIGVSETTLRDELAAGKSLAEVAAANGKTRDGLIEALAQATRQRIGELVDRKGTGPGGPFGHHGPKIVHDTIAAAATYLGTTPEDVRAKLRSGQTLAAIANATAGKTRDGLVQALVADATSRIAEAERAGTITADRASRLRADLEERLGRLVDSARPRRR